MVALLVTSALTVNMFLTILSESVKIGALSSASKRCHETYLGKFHVGSTIAYLDLPWSSHYLGQPIIVAQLKYA